MKIFVVILCLLSLAVLAILPVLAGERVPSHPFTRQDCEFIRLEAYTKLIFTRDNKQQLGADVSKQEKYLKKACIHLTSYKNFLR